MITTIKTTRPWNMGLLGNKPIRHINVCSSSRGVIFGPQTGCKGSPRCYLEVDREDIPELIAALKAASIDHLNR